MICVLQVNVNHLKKRVKLFDLFQLHLIMNMFDPAHPGELVRETLDGIKEETGNKLTVEQVAIGLGTTLKTLSAIINGKQGVSPEMALRFAKAFNTTPEFWLHAKENYDLAQARKKVDVKHVEVFWHPKVA
jgi:addiction module HigA family antidote